MRARTRGEDFGVRKREEGSAQQNLTPYLTLTLTVTLTLTLTLTPKP